MITLSEFIKKHKSEIDSIKDLNLYLNPVMTDATKELSDDDRKLLQYILLMTKGIKPHWQKSKYGNFGLVFDPPSEVSLFLVYPLMRFEELPEDVTKDQLSEKLLSNNKDKSEMFLRILKKMIDIANDQSIVYQN